jgi:hypothetical protein
MNYYNEHDPKAAAWLRELKSSILILNMNNAFYQATHGMLGKAPKLFPAIYNLLRCDAAHFFRVLAYELNPIRDALRRTRISLALSDCASESESGLSLEVVLILSFAGKLILDLDFSNATHELFLQRELFGIHLSMSISGSVPDQSENFYRTLCKHDWLSSVGANPYISNHIRENSIKSAFRELRSFSEVVFCSKDIYSWKP